jgi:hypothetical protein
MPTIRQYDVPVEAEVTVDFDVEVEEFLEDCDSYEIDNVIDWLKEKGHIKDTHIDRQVCATELEFIEALDKLCTKWNVLSKEEEAFIVNLAKRF